MATATIQNNRLSPSLSDLIEVTKAIRDDVQESLNGRFKDFEAEMSLRFSKLLEKEVQKKLVFLTADLIGRVDSLEKSYQEKSEQLMLVLKSMPVPQVTLNVPKDAIEVKQLPSNVSVSVPENAIQVNQMPSNVSVSVPENAIQINQLPSQVNVSDKAFDIHVNSPQVVVPENAIQIKLNQQETKVTVDAPKKRTTKSIVYSSTTGRPEKIIEESE